MLILTRNLGDRIFINDGEIKITILNVRGNQVRVGIEAPKKVNVHREEVFKRIEINGFQNKTN